jgi:hypothetical protein
MPAAVMLHNGASQPPRLPRQPQAMNDSHEIKKRYRAYLFMDGEQKFLGYFQTPEDAAMGRRQQAYLYIQEFLNYQS